MTLPAGVLLDMDGTLTDSEAIWFAAEVEVFNDLGMTWKDGDQYDIIGMALENSTALLVERYNLPITPMELGERLVNQVVTIGKRDGMPWRPGALELLQNLQRWGVPSALVTSSHQSFADLTLANAPEGTLTVAITGDQLERGKPDPLAYQLAAERLGVDVQQCVAFEDSEPGLRSAHGSGAHTVAVPFQVELPDLPGVRTISSLTEATREFLESFF